MNEKNKINRNILTAKEKAKELVSKYIHLTKQTTGANGTIYNSKQCALIAVDEILSINKERFYQLSGFKESFYKEVKEEIEKL